MAPTHPGNSRDFWKIATGVQLSPNVDDNLFGKAYFVDDTWAAYEVSYIHGSDIYRVSCVDVLADLRAVVSLLEQKVQTGEESPVTRAYIKWRNKNKSRGGTPLLEEINLERNRELIKEIKAGSDPDLVEEDIHLLKYRVAQEQEFWQRWERANWYWANGVFEWGFLSVLAIFSVWPVIRGRSALRWASHAAALPFLFLLPAYIGYATYTFTSAGPCGGILYPYLLLYCRGGSVNSADRWLLGRLPQILEPLSTPIGRPMALTGMGMPGPTQILLAGAIVGIVVFLSVFSFNQWRTRRSKTSSVI